MNRKWLNILIIVALLATLGITASAQDGGTETITFWSTELQPARVERQQNIIAQFQEANPGVEVELVVADENLMDQLITLNLATNTLPDVVLHPLQVTAKWVDQGILDPEFATEIIMELGEDTFSAGALELLRTPDGGYGAIPSDGWGQLLLYRRDLFEEAGLEPPTSYEAIMAAAEALHDPENDFIGFLGASHPGELYTWQVFEHIALANGAQLTDEEGNVTFNSPEMVEAIEFYAELMTNYGPPPGAEYYWQQTRADYLAGKGAMTIWSPFILDEMAGLRDSALPTCPECEEDIAFIARNSGFVSALTGYSSDVPAAYGSINSLGVSPNASPAAQAFVEFWMNEAYLEGLAIAPEGKFPMRRGTQEDPDLYLEGWSNLEVGVDRMAPLSDFYSAEDLEIIISGAEGYTRMGFGQGQDLLASAIATQFFIQEELVAVLNGEQTAEEAAEEIQIQIEDLQFELEQSS